MFCKLPLIRISLLFFIITLLTSQNAAIGQDEPDFSNHILYKHLQAPDSLNKVRFYSALGTGTAIYTASVAGLYNTWYKNHEQGKFHLFNDWREWEKMDKVGHAYSAYFESYLSHKMARWTGLDKNRAIWASLLGSTAIQLSIEIMDGFSTKWGFSVPDLLSNFAGSTLFSVQEYYLDDQIFKLKFSTRWINYERVNIRAVNSAATTTYEERANSLYGSSIAERLLKDYNAHHYWLSFNIESLTPGDQSWIPDWLDLSLGYSAENLFGGFDNSWKSESSVFKLDDKIFPRYRQYFLSFDIDLNKLDLRNPLLRSILSTFQIIKVPFPGLEYNSLGNWKWHWLVF